MQQLGLLPLGSIEVQRCARTRRPSSSVYQRRSALAGPGNYSGMYPTEPQPVDNNMTLRSGSEENRLMFVSLTVVD